MLGLPAARRASPGTHQDWQWRLAVNRLEQASERLRIERTHVQILPHRGREVIGRFLAKPSRVSSPGGNIARERPSLSLEIVHERLDQQRPDRRKLAPSHALDLLHDVRPIHLVIDPLTISEQLEKRALML